MTEPVTHDQAIDLSVIFTPKIRAWLYVVGFIAGLAAAALTVVAPLWVIAILGVVSAAANGLAFGNVQPMVKAQEKN